MAYTQNPKTGEIVISGFEEGIGDSPYAGLTDARNVTITSVPGEADVNFKTAKISSGTFSGSVTSASGSVLTYTGAAGIENYVAIYFTSVASYSGASTATPYWVGGVSASTFTIYSDYEQTSIVSLSGTGTATFVAYQIGVVPPYVTGAPTNGPKYFARPTNISATTYATFLVDGAGLVWGNMKTTTSGFWTYTGNTVTNSMGVSNASGNGLVYWRTTDGTLTMDGGLVFTDYLFVFRNSQIDFFVVAASSGGPAIGVWTYGWSPLDGTVANTDYLVTPPGTNNSHMAIINPQGRFTYCDADTINVIEQFTPTTLFNPFSGDTSTFSFFKYFLLAETNDIAQCIAPLGSNLLIGGQGNILYQWDQGSLITTNNLQMPESFTSALITVNTNTYAFVGNRGRIYVTNGSQLQLWKKIPDFITNTVEPYYQWQGICYNKMQLYCSFLATTNSGNAITTVGGVWSINTDTKGLVLANQLSFGTYAGYATAMISEIYNPVLGVNSAGTSLFIGWADGAGNFGLDVSIGNLYTNGESYITSDMIPIGTALQPNTSGQVEFKLSAPLLAQEKIELQIGSYLGGSFTSAGITTGSNSQTILSGNFPVTVEKQQWFLLKAIATSSGSNATPSFNRLKELRIIGRTQ